MARAIRNDAIHQLVRSHGPGGEEPLPALTRAGIAHLYFESIHPFEDAMDVADGPSLIKL